ncbi:cobalamin-binding protein [Tamilnaduibacter salinus]|uniref:Cobalamin-binding protein n=1 Tax=Tamilnaduibacter salinus TaxID=1484056 RepID=A0A2A2I2Y7_9GAMM|nr:cobalamin-binding protein [Tamilnaduibacter salinus]PAV25664.1 cobalamin-binding protein [Tamilnaduibacter salinus]
MTRGLQGAVLLLVLIPLAVAAGPRVTDDSGREVALSDPPERLISLAPHLTELLYSLGLGDRLVGVSAYSDYPSDARSLPRVGGHDRFDQERILALDPDLVVAWKSGTDRALVDRLEALGIPVLVLSFSDMQSIPDALETLGRMTGTSGVAGRQARAFRERLTALTNRYQTPPRIRVFYQVWSSPLITVAGDQYIQDVIRRCGGRNLFSELDGATATVTREAVLDRQPQLIVTAAKEGGEPLAEWRTLGGTPAVQYDQLAVLPPDTLARPSLRVLEGMERVCRRIEAARQAMTATGE